MTINTAMLVGLGFLIAALFAVVVAPAYRRRTVRLTTDALKRSLPLTEAEMRADKDRLRAEHAIRIHNLEAKLESVTLSSARQKIEVNRRDARISELEGSVTEQRTHLDELENARRVLEQTITDRLPKIESRLVDARKLLTQRDGEISTLAATAQKQARAIAEATQINVQQSAEIERLTSALATRAMRNQDSLNDDRFDGEIALRSEIDALRTKSREQSALIASLQELMARPSVANARSSGEEAAEAAIAVLKSELAQTQAELKAARTSAEAGNKSVSAPEIELSRLRAASQDTGAELARLKAALAAYESGDAGKKTKDSPVAAKARISALEAQVREQSVTIETLRSETAAVNERLARQASHTMEEMKRLGAGTLPASADARSKRPEAPKRSLFERINDPRVVQLTSLAEKRANEAGSEAPSGDAKVSPLFALTDQADEPSAAANGSVAAQPVALPPAPRRPRLLERITSIDKPGSN